MSAQAKALAIMRDLKDRLQKKLSTYTFAESQDEQGARLLISQDATPASGEQVVAIRILPEKTAFNDVIGLAQRVYAPLRVQVIEETAAAGAPLVVLAGVSYLKLDVRMAIDLELARMGLKQERYLNTNGTVPSVSQFAADGSVSGSSLVSVSPFDMYWPLSGQ